MREHINQTLGHVARLLSLMILAAFGAIFLMRSAPGYFSDARELDPEYAAVVRTELREQQSKQGKLLTQIMSLASSCLHGDFGQSRQFDIPVMELIKPRSRISSMLLLKAVGAGWLIAASLALPIGLRRGGQGEPIVTAITALLLAVPAGALATLCVLAECGGPATVLATLIAARDFKLLYKLVRQSRMAPHLHYARAQGIRARRITLMYLLPPLSRELLAIGVVSIIVALSAIVPVEVVFDVPGLGQLAWSAAMNRDLPVLLSVTLLMAAAVGLLAATTTSHGNEVSV